jgi:inorganic pyrophosphatase
MDNYSKYTLHPWHGVHFGEAAPDIVTSYVEIVPTDTVKYEVDKTSGIIKVDRPQQFSNIFPALYGFIPQTLCDIEVGKYCTEKTGRPGIVGDQDPLDICILTSCNIPHSNILVKAIPIGGFRMIDGNEADDKIIAVMKGDALYESWQELADANKSIIQRMKHYFLTYKDMPGAATRKCEITHTYGRQEAQEVIRKSIEDYKIRFAKHLS